MSKQTTKDLKAQIALLQAEKEDLTNQRNALLADVTRLTNENAELARQLRSLTAGPLEGFFEALDIKATNPIWKEIKCNRTGDTWRLYFLPEYYGANTEACRKALTWILNRGVQKGFLAVKNRDHIAISPKKEEQAQAAK